MGPDNVTTKPVKSKCHPTVKQLCHWAIVWWTIYTGNYKTREEANRAKKDYKLIDAIVSKTPYANLLSNFSSETDMNDKFHRLEKLGYSTYFIKGKKGTVRLFTGAFVNRKVAEKQNIALKAIWYI